MQLFHIHPFDFLIKPLKEEDVYHVMDELCACTDSERQIFEYRNSEGMHRIAYREIMYFTVRKRPSIWLQNREKRNSGGRLVM